jgi:hypothetical protein
MQSPGTDCALQLRVRIGKVPVGEFKTYQEKIKKLKTIITEAHKFIRHGVHASQFGQTILKSSLVAASVAFIGTSAAFADENRQGNETAAVSAAGQGEKGGVNQESTESGRKVAAQLQEAGLTPVAYVPAYRTGLRWKQ